MRVDGCMSAFVNAPGTNGTHTCAIYDDIPTAFVDSAGAKFYVLTD